MRNTQPENIQEHSLQVAIIAHGLAIIRNKYYGGNVNPERIITLAVFHEVGEVITGDVATPIKYFNPEIKKAFSDIEVIAKRRLLNMLPEEIRDEYKPLLFSQGTDKEEWKLVKVADKICAYIKCLEELNAGNHEFIKAEKTIRNEIEAIGLPEVSYFMEKFAPSFLLTLDELN